MSTRRRLIAKLKSLLDRLPAAKSQGKKALQLLKDKKASIKQLKRAITDISNILGKLARAVTASFALIKRGSKVLGVKNRHGEWTLPGGTRDGKEGVDKAMIREVKEEIGLTVKPVASPSLTVPYAGGSKVGAVFQAIVSKGKLTLQKGEILAARFISPSLLLPRFRALAA